MKFFNKITIFFLGCGILLSCITILSNFYNRYWIIVILFIPLIATLMGYLAAQSMHKNLIKLNQSVDIILSGDLDYPLAANANHLFRNLSQSINNMVNSLKDALSDRDQLYEEINDLKSKMNELDSMGKYFYTLFNGSTHGVFIHTFEGKIIDVNKKASEMLEYSKEVLIGSSFFTLQPKKELFKCKEANKIDPHTCSVRYETIFLKKNKQPINVEISTNVLDMKNSLVLSLVSNITSQKQMIQALELSEEKFRTFMETANDLMFITDKKGQLTYINQSMCHTLGLSEQADIDINLMEIIHNESDEDDQSIQNLLLADANEILEVVWITKDLRKLHGEMKTIGIFDDRGKFQGLRGIFRDITERKKIEESQRLAQLGKLAADVAHELKNQLTVLFSLTELSLMEGTDSAEIKENMQSIYHQCEHLRDVVKRLLMFSKPSEGNYRVVDIHQVIEFVMKLIEKSLMKDEIQVFKAYNFQIPSVRIDEQQLQEVLMNLIQNASESMENGGQMEIKTSFEKHMVRIDIQDSGSGISEENLKLIFNPFFTTKESGSGLGVSACYGSIKAHGGDLKYTSHLGVGTTATILLPPYEN